MLDESVKRTVEEMILSTQFTYRDMVEYIRDTCGKSISLSAICRYARGFNADMGAIQMAREHFRVIMQECSKYPDMDTTEGIVYITSNLMMTAVRALSEDDLKDTDPIKLIKQATELVRAVSYKRSMDIKNKELTEMGFDAAKEKLFTALEAEKPELYKELAEFITAKSKEVPES